MIFLQQYSLKKHNTFGIDAKAQSFVEVHSEEELRRVLTQKTTSPILILGGGSNILLRSDVAGLVVKNSIKGRIVVEEEEEKVLISVGGGENWHQFVEWCLSKNFAGLENLSLIPGTVGAAPIQNIGAYGVELESVFEKLEAIELSSQETHIFSHYDCQFGYRDSIFKRALKGKYCITRVYFRLSKTPKINISYGAIKQQLADWGISEPNIQEVSKAVIHIRRSKLPDPVELGNSGSFFKNPEIEQKHFERLKTQFPDIVHYDLPNGNIKIPAGWLIERAGWKGKKIGNTGSHAQQALVLVNYGGATGTEVYQLAMDIQASIEVQFGIRLMPEVNVW